MQSTLVMDRDVVESADADLRRRVVNYLMGRQVSTLRQIEVEAVGGTVVLRGQVRSFYEKQLCIHCCRRVAGVIQLIDEIAVVAAPVSDHSVA